jgi:uncharacterized membrane protein HdeD (DUF308 family)
MQQYLPITSLLIGAWMTINGILHDIAVLRSEHGRQYDRNLLRLLMDGHILITCGVIDMICYMGFKENQHWAYYIAAATSVSILVYCAMIWPFLKSIFTVILNLALLVLLIVGYWLI